MTAFHPIWAAILWVCLTLRGVASDYHQPLSKIAIHKATAAVHGSAYIKVTPSVLGLKGGSSEWVTVEYGCNQPSTDDSIGVFSPSNFNESSCSPESPRTYSPLLCTAPIKFQYATYLNPEYEETGNGTMRLQLINQRSDFSFALFTGGLSNVVHTSVNILPFFISSHGGSCVEHYIVC